MCGAELADRLELEAGKFQHVPAVVARACRPSRVTGVPILPPTCTGTPASRRMWPIRLVVVVLPFEPVIPMVRPLRNGAASSTSPITAHAAPARRLERRQVGRHVGREHDQVAAFEHLGRSAGRRGCPIELAASGSWSSGLRSVARTTAPCARAGTAADATPDFFIPTTSALRAFDSHGHLSFNVVSANSASTRPAIQKRAMIFDSVQPSASK